MYRYQQIAEWAEERIRDGRWPAKTVVSEVKLQNYFGVGRVTIRAAMRILRDKGLIMTLPGKGSVVLEIRSNGDILD